MISAWIGTSIGLIAVVAGIVVALRSKKAVANSGAWLWSGICLIVFGAVLAVGLFFWLYGTESGARAQKTFSSETGGGLTRIVKVYDMQGQLIQSYTGQFDIEYDDERVLFDIPQEDGSYKRVQIWSKTGTVITEELPGYSAVEQPK